MAKKLVLQGASLKCTQGLSPSTLVLQPGPATADGKAVATVMDFLPMTNIPPFGMCQSLANPQVAAATAAAQGVLTPQPCIPVITAPWSPGSEVSTIQGTKLLTADSTCNCQWVGRISISHPGSEITTR
ncbi:MAG: DUF4280 domain-containing protein [Deltaproteobacteria bacterium]|nr:MAG: DUF4280 domain-containing protein [Deltaproteobacteria bacterium]TMQ16548.1 MAG: DUF4280 domain-containing protein [Deltaproteobacteria bacterium]